MPRRPDARSRRARRRPACAYGRPLGYARYTAGDRLHKGYADYAAPAFDLDAADYLIKPLTAARVEEAVRRVRSRLSRPAGPEIARAEMSKVPRVFLPQDDHHVALAPEVIRYAVAHQRFCEVHTDGETHRLRARLSRLEELLAPYGFVRTHRAYLVNLHRVRALVPWSRHVASVLLDDGGETHIPVAKSRLSVFRRSVVWIAAGGGRPRGRPSR
jgi:DNA-binding LytR/AlgR family response regulator